MSDVDEPQQGVQVLDGQGSEGDEGTVTAQGPTDCSRLLICPAGDMIFCNGSPGMCSHTATSVTCNGVTTYCPRHCVSDGNCEPSCTYDPDCSGANTCYPNASCQVDSECGLDGLCENTRCVCY